MNYIYVGASNKSFGLVQHALYKDKPEKLIELLKEKFSLIENLFVPIEEFIAYERELAKSESLISKAFRQTKEAK